MHDILKNFLDKWVYPTGFTGPGVEFRLRPWAPEPSRALGGTA